MGDAQVERVGNAAPRLIDVLRIRIVGVLFAAEFQSLVGDQLARVALSVLVFDRTDNAAATAATYAATFLPAILGGALLARIADRMPRRTVMVGADVVRAIAFAAMCVPQVPLLVLELLLIVAVFVEPAFTAAQSSYLAARLDAEQYRAVTGLRMAGGQLMQVVGFGVGGTVVAVLAPRGALAIDAISFGVSALLITVGLGRADHEVVRSVGPTREVVRRPSPVAHELRGRWQARSDARIVYLLTLTSLAGLFVVPEGLAIPYADERGASTQVAGVLLASIPAGGVIGALVLLRAVRPNLRGPAMAAMAIACGVPLLVTAAHPAVPIVAAMWLISGAAAAYQVEIFSELAQLVPDEHRGRILGLAGGIVTGVQGVGLGVFGLIAQVTDAAFAIALAGGIGVLVATAVTTVGHRHRVHRYLATATRSTVQPARPT